MSHLHLPDGVLPLWLWLGGLAVLVLILGWDLRRLKKTDLTKRLPLLAVIAALMVLGMSFEILPLFYHLNLTVLAGIVLGPALGIVAVFLSNLILALFGHGGITVIGLNSLILMAEMITGWFLFQIIFKPLSRHVFWRGFLAALFALVISTLIAVGIVTLGGAEFERFLEASILLGALGWVLEALVTGFIVSYLKKMRPEIIKT